MDIIPQERGGLYQPKSYKGVLSLHLPGKQVVCKVLRLPLLAE